MDGLLRSLWASLCQFLYQILAWLYELFINVSRVEILTTDNIEPIYQRITMILTIVMVFYVTFEAVKYVVQPDDFTDKEKGGGKLASKMIIVVVLIAFVPTFFSVAYKFQNIIFDNQVFSKVILGKQSVDTNQFGRVFSANLLGMFYYVDEYKWDEKTLKEESNCEDIPCATIVNANLSNLIEYGELPLMQVGLNEGDELTDEGTGDVFQYYIHFDGLFAVLVGGFVCYMLALYCIDIGVRVVQLTFLQIIAPIPIIGYLSPKKDGMFQKWVKQCTATYLDLFIRTGIIYFGLLICQVVSEAFATETLFNNIPGDTSTTMKVFIYIALILGILMFLSKAPKLLGELFPKTGVASGNFGLKAKDRIAPAAARAAGAALGSTRAIGGMVGRAASRAIRNRANKAERDNSRQNMDEAKKNKRDAQKRQGTARKRAELNQKAQDAKSKVAKAADAYKNAKTPEEAAKRKAELDKASAEYRGILAAREKATFSKDTQAKKASYVNKRNDLTAAQKELEDAKNSKDPNRINAAEARVNQAKLDFDTATKEYTQELRKNAEVGTKYADLIEKKQASDKQNEAIKDIQQKLETATTEDEKRDLQQQLDKLTKEQSTMQNDIAEAAAASKEAVKAETRDQYYQKEIKETESTIQKANQQYEEAAEIYEQTKKQNVVLGGIEGAIKGGITGAWTGAHATNIKEIFTKTAEGWKKDADAIRKENAYVDKGGAIGIKGIVDRTTAKIEKTIGYDTAYERIALNSKKYDNQKKEIEARTKLTQSMSSSISKVEDRLKSKALDLKTIPQSPIETGLKHPDGSPKYAEVQPGETTGQLIRRYEGEAERKKTQAAEQTKDAMQKRREALEAKERAKLASEKYELAKDNDKISDEEKAQLAKEKEILEQEAIMKDRLAEISEAESKRLTIESTNAEYEAGKVKTNAVRESYSQIIHLKNLDPTTEEYKKLRDLVEPAALEMYEKETLSDIASAKEDRQIREMVHKALQEKYPNKPNEVARLYQAFIDGHTQSWDDLDLLDQVNKSVTTDYSVESRKIDAKQTKETTSVRAQQVQAANDAAGNSGK